MSRLTRDGTAEPASRDQILRREREQGNGYFRCSADHERYWQPYPVDPYSCYMCDHTVVMSVFSTRYIFYSIIIISTLHVRSCSPRTAVLTVYHTVLSGKYVHTIHVLKKNLNASRASEQFSGEDYQNVQVGS